MTVSKNPVGFPTLPSCRGFSKLQRSRCIDCCWGARDLKANLGSQGKIYIVPNQKSLSTKPTQESENSTLKDECYICQKQILIRELREHLWDCKDESQVSDEGDDSLMYSAFNTSRNQGDIISPSTTSTITESLLFPLTTQSESQRSNSITSAAAATALIDLTSKTSLLATSSTSNSDYDDDNNNNNNNNNNNSFIGSSNQNGFPHTNYNNI